MNGYLQPAKIMGVVPIVEGRHTELAIAADQLVPAAKLALCFEEAARLVSVFIPTNIERGNLHVVHSLEQYHSAMARIVAHLSHVHIAKLTRYPIC